MNYPDRQKELKELSFIDEANSYEVDEAGIYLDERTGKFVLLLASGCSCWDYDDYSEFEFNSLDELEAEVKSEKFDKHYPPGKNGIETLIREARMILDAK